MTEQLSKEEEVRIAEYQIGNDPQADLHGGDALYDMARAEADLETMAKLDRQVAWYETAISEAKIRRAKLENRLKWFGEQYRRNVGRSRLSLANGATTAIKTRARWEVTDPDAFEKFCHDNGYSKWAADFVKAKEYLHYDTHDGSAAIGGKRVDFIRRIIPADDEFTVKVTVGAKEIAVEEEGDE